MRERRSQMALRPHIPPGMSDDVTLAREYENGLSATLQEEPPVLLVSDISDDRANVTNGDKVLLVIEDDVRYLPLLIEMGRERGFKCRRRRPWGQGTDLVPRTASGGHHARHPAARHGRMAGAEPVEI